jgi:hypothetical protein
MASEGRDLEKEEKEEGHLERCRTGSSANHGVPLRNFVANPPSMADVGVIPYQNTWQNFLFLV